MTTSAATAAAHMPNASAWALVGADTTSALATGASCASDFSVMVFMVNSLCWVWACAQGSSLRTLQY